MVDVLLLPAQGACCVRMTLRVVACCCVLLRRALRECCCDTGQYKQGMY